MHIMEAPVHRSHSHSPKLNIAQVVQHLQPGGIETMVIDMAQGMNHVNTQVISIEGEQTQLRTNWPRIAKLHQQWQALDKAPGIQISIIQTLKRLFVQQQIDVVHTHHIGPLLYAGIAAKLCGCKIVHTEHDAWHLSSFKRRQLQKCLIRILNPIVIADAQVVAEQYQRYIGKKVDGVIENGVDLAKFRAGNKQFAKVTLGLPTQHFIVGSAGRLEKVKGHRYLLDALSQLPQSIHLAIAGSGSQAHVLKQQAQQLGITDRVTFLGHLENMRTFYQAIDVFCLPSLQEGYPLSTLEAQACNTPCIATDVGGSKETLCPLTSRLIPPKDAAALASAIAHYQTTTAEMEPRQHVFEHNNFSITKQRYLSYYMN